MAPQPLSPGTTGVVTARSALVLAPHFDDEVLGCGGLLAQLAAAGARVRVLFLSDGSGGIEAVADRPAYAARRRDEAVRATAALGVADLGFLALRDGELELAVEELARAVAEELAAARPELVLVPSPLEATGDHRSAFAALHRVLSRVREGDELAPIARPLAVLAYEVNHPAYPDLLVDVSAQLPLLERAMAAYASQEERHPYLAAALGLRAYRTHTLASSTRAVEAYRRLSATDFVTRSLSGLTRELGGAWDPPAVTEGPSISVVVRTRDRPAQLAEALASLAASSYRRFEVVLVNDGGRPPELASDLGLALRRVELEENRGRAEAANAGIAAATGDAVAFLDDDDLVEREHLATLAGLLAGSGARVAYTDAGVGIYEPDAERGYRCVERRLPYSRDFDPELLLVDNYIPFHTLLLERALLLETGPLDRELPIFEDWDLLVRLAERTRFVHLAQVTCEYRHFRSGADHALGERGRERADFAALKARVLAKHSRRLTPDLVARVVDRLRAEAVARGEELAATSAADRREIDELRAEVARRSAELARHQAVVEDQTAHLGRTYGEIERLHRLLQEMRSTRAWRMHEWWHRKGR